MARKPAAPTVSVYAESLVAIRGVTPDFAEQHPKESTQTFIKRIAKAISDLPEAAYDALSPAVVAWFEAAADQVTAKADVTAPEGMPESAAPVAEEAPKKRTGAQALAEINAKRKAEKEAKAAADAAAGVDPAKAKADAKAAAPKAKVPKAKVPKAEKAPKAAKEARVPKEGIIYQLRKLVLVNPDITSADMQKQFPDAKISSIAVVRHDMQCAIRILKELGKLK